MKDLTNKIILGLDISTTCLGISIYKTNEINYQKNGEIILIEGLNLKNKEINKIKGIESLFIKKKLFHTRLIEIKNIIKQTYNRNIDYVFIEEPLLQSNNINTVGILLRFNGMISDIIYNELNIVPEYISSYNSRYYAFPELVSVHTFNKKNEKRDIKEIRKAIKDNKVVLFGAYPFSIEKKQVILDKITEKFPNINWLENKKGELSKSNFDGADAICCCIGWLNKEYYNSEKLQIVDSIDKGNYIEYTTSFREIDKFKHIIRF